MSSEHDKAKPWRPRYGVRSLLVVLAVFSVWLASVVNIARHQAAAVESLEETYAHVFYDYQQDERDFVDPRANSWVPSWLLERASVDLFHTVVYVNLSSSGVTVKL